MKEKAYAISKEGKNNVDYFLFHYYLNGYCHIAPKKHIYLIGIDMDDEVGDASCEVHALLMIKVEFLK